MMKMLNNPMVIIFVCLIAAFINLIFTLIILFSFFHISNHGVKIDRR
jgi:hypothetical protein